MRIFKFVLTVSFFTTTSGAIAADNVELMDCQLSKLLDDTVFEESLSFTEYPTLSVDQDKSGKYTVTIGSAGFRTENGTIISYHSSGDYDLASDANLLILSGSETFNLTHKMTDSESIATLTVRKGEASPQPVAEFVCGTVTVLD